MISFDIISDGTDVDAFNKKSELMLMRRARTYSSSCSPVILVYLHPFRGNLLFCSRKWQKVLKPLFLKF